MKWIYILILSTTNWTPRGETFKKDYSTVYFDNKCDALNAYYKTNVDPVWWGFEYTEHS